MKRLLIAAAALAVLPLATPKAAQAQYYGGQGYSGQGYSSYGGYNTGYGYRAPQRRSWGYDRSYGGQADVPGDYRCDAFWDANRDDCGARWRDQRRYGGGYRNTGYGHGYYGQGYGQGYGGGYYGRGRGYGYGGYAPAGQAYYGAYGRPDLVYSSGGGYGGGYGGYQTYNGARNPGRVAYCQSRFRSYDPNSGYYRGYSGRLIFCG